MKKIALFLVLSLSIGLSVLAQNKLTKTNKDPAFRFDEKDLDKYKTDIVEYFSDNQDPKTIQAVQDFATAYDSYTNDKLQIVKTSNIYLKKHALESTHFINYTKIVILMHQNGRDPANYTILESMIENILVKQKKGTKTVDDYIVPLILLHEKGLMYSNQGAINWKTSTKDFKLDYNKELIVEYSTTDLICNDYNDSMMIQNTSGKFIIDKDKWEGNSGKVTWLKTGLPENETFVEFGKYTIDLKKKEYKIPEANFTHTKYFQTPLKGRFHDKLQNVKDSSNRNYPQFVSNTSVEIKEVLEGVDYKGPFTMQGARFLGSNENNDIATIQVKKDNEVKVFANSRNFIFSATQIRGEQTSIKIPIDDGEIRHPSVIFYYKLENKDNNLPKRKIEMIRSGNGLGKSAFYNTYHRLEMDFEQITWYLDSTNIDFNNITGTISASGRFNSLDFFNLELYNKLQRADKQHPLVAVKKYSEALGGTRKIDVNGLSQYMRYPSNEVTQMLLNLAQHDFISFDLVTGQGEIQDRLYDYLKYRANKKDYDTLIFDSKLDTLALTKLNKDSPLVNLASLDLNNLDLTISNIEEISISSVHNVVCIPPNGKITMKKNRDFVFDGELRTEFIEFVGTQFAFKYDEFKFDMDSIGFLRILIKGEPVIIKGESMDKQFYIPYEPKAPEGRGAGILKRLVFTADNTDDTTYVVRKNIKGESIDTVIQFKKDLFKKEVVQSRIENITGYLLIDHPSNKSGDSSFVKYAQYPHFFCTDSSTVYYDKYYNEEDQPRSILGEKYTRDKFYFKLDTFNIDSLGSFTSKSWRTYGLFHSGIFPDFNEFLTIQEDTVKTDYGDVKKIYSLGFVKDSVETYPVYEGMGSVQGTVANSLKLSNKGLHGAGSLNYITTTIQSNDFVYFPDYMLTDATISEVEERGTGTQYAQVFGKNNFVEWLPAQDSLVISGAMPFDSIANERWEVVRNDIKTNLTRNPFEMYNGEAALTGQTVITPNAHKGSGLMEFSNSELTSKEFIFQMAEYQSPRADFLIKALGFSTPAFTAQNVKADISYSENKGVFEALDGKRSKAVFPVNQFMTYMDMFIWDIERNEIEVGEKTDDNSKRLGSEYISIHPQQDSLRFISYSSGYSLEDFILKCYEVDSIDVANGLILPDTTIIIKANAEIEPLTNAIIIADKTHRYHNITDMIITIKGRNEIKGLGKYDYYFYRKGADGIDTTHFEIRFTDVSSTRTDPIIRAYTSDKDSITNFDLNEHFIKYNGKIKLYTDQKHLVFSGSVEINNTCAEIIPQRIPFEGNINPDTVVIELPAEMVDANKQKIVAGFYSSGDSIYNAFFTKRMANSDVAFLNDSVNNVLYYDDVNKDYVITSKLKYLNPDTLGSVVALNKFCIFKSDGHFDLGLEVGQIQLENIGKARKNLTTKDLTIENFMVVDLFFNDKAIDAMAELIQKDGMLNAAQDDGLYAYGLKHLLGIEKSAKLVEEITNYGQLRKVPAELEKTFVFSNVKLKWNKQTNSYISDGDLNIANIKGKQINKAVSGYIEIIRKKAGDEIHIYFDLGVDWFYFNTLDHVVYGLSTLKDFQDAVKSVKPNDAVRKVAGVKDISYTVGSDDLRKKFLLRVTGKAPAEEEGEPVNNNTPTDEDNKAEEDEGYEGQ